jgi:HEAT repeat protein
MSIRVTCSGCGTSFRIDDRWANKRIACRQCRTPIQVPAAPPAPLPEPSPPVSAAGGSNVSRGESATFDVPCPGCGNITVGYPNLVGKRVRCKRCDQVFRVSDAAAQQPVPRAVPRSQPAVRQPAPAQPPQDDRPYNVLAGIDDLELAAAAKVASTPLAPAAPVQRLVRRNWEPSESDNDWLGTVGLAYYLLAIVLLAVGYFYRGEAILYAAPVLLVGLPHIFCYLLALFRMVRCGDAVLAIVCLLSTCFFLVGEIVALIVTYQNKEKYRLGGLYTAWATLFGLIVTGVLVALLLPAVMAARVAVQRAEEHNAAIKRGEVQQAPNQPAARPPSPNMPGQPAADAVVNSEEALQLKRQLNDNQAQMLALLRGVTDKASAERALPQRAKLLADGAAIQQKMPRSLHYNGPLAEQWNELTRGARDTAAAMNIEEQRLRTVAGVAPILGLGPDMTIGRSDRAAAAARRKDRPPANTPDEKITRALEDIDSGTVFERRDAIKQLRKLDVDPARQQEVAKALAGLLSENDHFVKEDAAATLETWATADSVPALVRFLEDSGLGDADARRSVMRALARLKDSRGTKAIAQQLFTRDAQAAVTVLKTMGSAAEPTVIGLLDHQDPALRQAMCGILEEIGTQRSIPELRKRASDRVPAVKAAARSAIAAISARTRGSADDAGTNDTENTDAPKSRTPGRRNAADMLKPVTK